MLYGGADKVKRVKLQSLRRQFEMLTMKDRESVAEFFNRMQQLVNSMKTCGEPLSDQQIVEKILRSLTPKYDYICVAIEESRDITKMKVEDLLFSLETHEQRLLDRQGVKSQEQALHARFHHQNDGGKSKFQKGKERWKAKKADKGDPQKKHSHPDSSQSESSDHKRGDYSKGKGERKPWDKKKIQCYNCSKWGHYADQCRSGKGGK